MRSPQNKTIKVKFFEESDFSMWVFIGVNNVSMVSRVDGVKHVKTHTRSM